MNIDRKHILVTGGAGFIGSHLVEKLLEKKCLVIVPYIEILDKSYFVSQKLGKKVKLIKCDIRNYNKLSFIIKKYKVEYIFHLAAKAIVGDNFMKPLEALETNIMGTVNICESARNNKKIKGLIITSSDKAYGKIPRVRETNPLCGDHPYEVSKSSADLIAQSYFKTYNLPIIVTRFGNVYGEGDINFSRIIPGIMNSIVNKRGLEIRSNGKYIRDYVYVEDVVDATLALTNNIKQVQGEAFNISSYENLSVIEVIKRVEGILAEKVQYKILSKALNEIPVQSVNFSKIRNALGWKPVNNFESTIPGILTWYQAYFYLH